MKKGEFPVPCKRTRNLNPNRYVERNRSPYVLFTPLRSRFGPGKSGHTKRQKGYRRDGSNVLLVGFVPIRQPGSSFQSLCTSSRPRRVTRVRGSRREPVVGRQTRFFTIGNIWRRQHTNKQYVVLTPLLIDYVTQHFLTKYLLLWFPVNLTQSFPYIFIRSKPFLSKVRTSLVSVPLSSLVPFRPLIVPLGFF